MRIEDLSLFRNHALSDDEIEKLKIVSAFYETLPCDSLKAEMFALMETQPSLPPCEFVSRLEKFAEQVTRVSRTLSGSYGSGLGTQLH